MYPEAGTPGLRWDLTLRSGPEDNAHLSDDSGLES